MKSLPILLGLMAIIGYQPIDAIVLSTFQQQALEQHNYYRQQLHCTTAMTLNSTLNAIAQNYSQYLADNSLFSHSGAAGLGENLWMSWSSVVITFVNGSQPTNSWYNEISLYNYSSPGFSSATGHFTQVVWSDSVQLGIGIAFTSNNQSAYVVANYYPPGNYIGQFATKVPPLCSSSTTSGTTASTGSSASAGSSTSSGTTVSTGSSTSAGGSTTSRTTVTTRTSTNSAIGMIRQGTHLLASLVMLGSIFI